MRILSTLAAALLIAGLTACGETGCGAPQQPQAAQGGCDGYVTANPAGSSSVQPYQCVRQCPAGHTAAPVEVDERTGRPWTQARGVCVKQ